MELRPLDPSSIPKGFFFGSPPHGAISCQDMPLQLYEFFGHRSVWLNAPGSIMPEREEMEENDHHTA